MGNVIKHNCAYDEYKENLTKVVPIKKTTAKTEHIYKGKKNETDFPEFIELCKYTQEELKSVLPGKLLELGYTEVVIEDGFIYAKGKLPVLLTAHMDTVHKEPVKDFYEYINDEGNHIISSPQGIGGDDRCGIYMILDIALDYKPSILFCEDEEIGRVGAKKFCSKTEFIEDLKNLNFLVELDRRDSNDAVFYSCDNPDFTKFVCDTTGYKEAHGSYSDISSLAPKCGVAAVNLSCGYYHAHQLTEEVVVEEMFDTMDAVVKLLEAETEQFEYIEKKYTSYNYGNYGDYYGNYYGGGSYNWDNYDDDEDFDYEEYAGYYNRGNYSTAKIIYMLMVELQNPDDETETITETVTGFTKADCWWDFFVDHPDVCYNDIVDYYYDYDYM